jgi:hypothetical protein
MAIPFTDILQDGDLPVRFLGVYTHFSDIVSVYALKGLSGGHFLLKKTNNLLCLPFPSPN